MRVRASRERTRAVRECVCVCAQTALLVERAKGGASPVAHLESSNPRSQCCVDTMLSRGAICCTVSAHLESLPAPWDYEFLHPKRIPLRIAPHPCVTDTMCLIELCCEGITPSSTPPNVLQLARTLCSTRTLETHMRALPHASNAALCTAFLHSRLFAWPASAASGLSTTRDSVGS